MWKTITSSDGNSQALYFSTLQRERSHQNNAIFDLDSTLIKTKSGNVMPKNRSDWKWFSSNVIPKLAQESKTHNIIIISNQKGIVEKNDPKGALDKIQDICEILMTHSIEVEVYVAIDDDAYRKPSPNLYREWIVQVVSSNTSDYYIGDAAGRKGDFASSDYCFALNCGIHFSTPEEFFDGKQQISYSIPFDAKKFSRERSNNQECNSFDEYQIIILVGPPGSSKSTFCKNYFPNHTIINRDTLKTKDRCLKEFRKNIESGKSCIVDNTNPSVESRAPYLDIAKDKNIPIVCIVMEATYNNMLLQHLNNLRLYRTGQKVPAITQNIFKKNFIEPMISEGFDQIIKPAFQPIFNNNKEKNEFEMNLVS